MTARVVVVGLGPAGPELINAATRRALEGSSRRYLRTVHHPSAMVVEGAESFDGVYERASSLEEVYHEIAEHLVEAAHRHGEVLYAVPGSPVVAERSVELLRAGVRVEVEIVPAMSFLDLVWARLGVDPLAASPRLVDGHSFAVEAAGERGPLLVAQCDRASVLSDIKLSVEQPPEAPVTVLSHLGLAEESIVQVAWEELDRAIRPDHLTSLWIPELAAPVGLELARLVEIVARLRAECPWDREQTHQSLAPHLLEEAYELLEVLEAAPGAEAGRGDEAFYPRLEEELGDVLLQVLLHARLASETGQLDLVDVARRLHDKLVLRHPHVFGEVEVEGAGDVAVNWERIKKDAEGKQSTFDGVPASLPALARAAKVVSKGSRLGLGEATGPALAPGAPGVDWSDPRAVGELLLSVAAAASAAGVDPEAALRRSVTMLEQHLRRREAAPG